METKNRKPRIAVIGLKGLPAFGGAATVGENIIEQLKDKYDFTVYSTSSHTDLKTGEYHGYKQIVFKKLPLKKLNSLYYYIISAIHAVVSGKYDLVHLHHRAFTVIVPLLKLRFPVIITTHGMVTESKFKKISKIFELQDKIFFNFANLITTVSKKDYRLVQNKVKIKSNKLIYIPNAVDISNEFDEKLDEDYLLFSAGRIFESKGCHIFLESLLKINYRGKVIIIGDLDHSEVYKKRLFNIAKGLDRVKFVDIIKDKKLLFDYLSKARLFVYPSTIESMSIMLLEVASLKTPIICSRIKENEDIFSNEDVLFAKPNDSGDLGNKINYALSNYKEMQKKAINAFELIKLKYQWCNISSAYNECYKKILMKQNDSYNSKTNHDRLN